MQCPNPTCHSTNISSNHIPEHWMENVAHVVHGAHSARSHFFTFGGFALWGAMKAINSLRSAWRCDRCGASFDA